jgi:Phage tail lysozyme
VSPFAIYMLSWLTLHGYPLVQRDAVYFIAMAESGVRPNAVSPVGQIGLFQLDGSRKYALADYARAKGRNWTSIKMQLEFMDREWRAMPASAAFFATGDRATALHLFCRYYEGGSCGW